jgi:stage III sporulation protein AG
MDNKVIYIDNSKNDSDINVNNKSSINNKLLKLLTKRNLKIISLIIIGLVALIIFMSIGKDQKTTETFAYSNSSGYTTTLQYCAELENKLKAVLSNIDGAGQVSVMVSVDGSPELVYATEDDNKITNNSSGTTSQSNSSSPIIVDVGGKKSALILTENLPKVKGVIVASSGAGNVAVKLNILNAVSTLMDISVDKVSVLKGL